MKQNLEFLNTAIVRSPLLPCHSKDSSHEILDEAIYIASSSLHEQYQKFKRNFHFSKKETDKLKISIQKYKTRASTRCTPFGLFSGIKVVEYGAENNIEYNSNPLDVISRKTKLNMVFLSKLAQVLEKHDDVRPCLLFFTNTSIYKVGEKYRYVEYYFNDLKRLYKITEVDYSEGLEFVLNHAKSGITITELINLLVSNDLQEDDSIAFVDELLDSQLLVSELEPNLTGSDYLNVIIDKLNKINQKTASIYVKNSIDELSAVKSLLINIDESGVADVETYNEIIQRLNSLIDEPLSINYFHVDSFKISNHASISYNVQENILKAINLFNKLTPVYENKLLELFKQRFRERYGDKEIALLQALDVESGIGYPEKDIYGINELVDDIQLVNSVANTGINLNEAQLVLKEKLNQTIKDGKQVIYVSDEDFMGINYSSDDLPDSFSVFFKILNSKTNKIAIQNNIGASSAINTISRFSGGCEAIDELMLKVLEHEKSKQNEGILAEIIHLPDSRLGNILCRNKYHEYEIPYLTNASVEKEFQIDVSDLYLSLKGNYLYLRSKRLNKEIIPRLGTAHNYENNSLPVYHFLCDLQVQKIKKPYLSFGWGQLIYSHQFLPRIEYQSIILSPAKWCLKRENFIRLINCKSDDELKIQLIELVNQFQLPKLFLVVDGDNEMLIDTTDIDSVYVFVDLIKKKDIVLLEEFLFSEIDSLIKDTNGEYYTNECVAIVLNHFKHKDNKFDSNPILQKTIEPCKIEESKWIYFKIFCGVKTTDTILIDNLKPFIDDLIQKVLIDKWFFIRYSDPEPHIRFRIHLINIKIYKEIVGKIEILLSDLIESDIVLKIEQDNYEEELDRYGENTMGLAETLFFNDSKYCMNVLSYLQSNSTVVRWHYALLTVDTYLNDFDYSIEQKVDFMKDLSMSFFNEHGANKTLRVQLDQKYRIHKADIEKLFNHSIHIDDDFKFISNLIRERSIENKLIYFELKKIESNNQIQVSIDSLLASYIHMALNRIFISKRRVNEMVIYDLLYRYYKSLISRSK